MNISVLDRFLKYVSVGSQSDTDSATVPSTPGPAPSRVVPSVTTRSWPK